MCEKINSFIGQKKPIFIKVQVKNCTKIEAMEFQYSRNIIYIVRESNELCSQKKAKETGGSSLFH